MSFCLTMMGPSRFAGECCKFASRLQHFCDTLLSWIQCYLLCFIFVHVWYFARIWFIRGFCWFVWLVLLFYAPSNYCFRNIVGFGLWLWLDWSLFCYCNRLIVIVSMSISKFVVLAAAPIAGFCLFVCFTIDTSNYCICNYICNVVLHCFWLFFFSHMIAKKRLGRYIITIAVDSITHEKSEWSTLHPRNSTFPPVV